MARHALFLLALLALLGGAVAAEPNPYRQHYDDCLREHGPINNGVVAACAEGTSELVKRDMNRLYQALYRRLEQQRPEHAAQLERAQRAWLRYRKEHCELQGALVGSPLYLVCPMEMNIERVAELQYLLDNGG